MPRIPRSDVKRFLTLNGIRMVDQQIQVHVERCGEVSFGKELATLMPGDIELLGHFDSEFSARGRRSTTEDAAAEVVRIFVNRLHGSGRREIHRCIV